MGCSVERSGSTGMARLQAEQHPRDPFLVVVRPGAAWREPPLLCSRACHHLLESLSYLDTKDMAAGPYTSIHVHPGCMCRRRSGARQNARESVAQTLPQVQL